jgi:hypothetical protein
MFRDFQLKKVNATDFRFDNVSKYRLNDFPQHPFLIAAVAHNMSKISRKTSIFP